VLHRDVKPSNLFGSPQTGVRLGDFGIAVARGIRQSEQYGTLRFVAPETLRGEEASRRSDIYSLGATAFDLYYGSPPLTRLADILRGAPLPFPEPRSAEEAAFQHILKCMLEFDPERRPASAKVAHRQFGKMARALAPSLPVVQLARGQYQLGSVLVTCSHGDIADAEVDGIVNSANDDMRMRTGVGGCLRARGGQLVEDEASLGGRRALGQCIATSGGALKCRHVLHAVAGWKEASCIARASQRALLLAEELGLRTIALPALGTGVARVTPEACAYAAASALHQHVLLGGTRLREVRFVLYDRETLEIFIDELNGVFLGESDFVEQSTTRRSDPALEETLHLESVRTQSAPPESL
jgi:eukaryotic-like serine/threonine-protein kinase